MKIFIKIFAQVILFLTFIEIFLRLGGITFLGQQEIQNRLKENVSYNRIYKIVCIGDSMTTSGGEDNYPNQLEKILNSKQNQIHFIVINKGMPGATTKDYVASINTYLKEYNPQLVITLLGDNPGGRPPDASSPEGFLNKIEVYRLSQPLLGNLRHFLKVILPHIFFDKFSNQIIHVIALTHLPSQQYALLGKLFQITQNYGLSERCLEKAVQLAPKNFKAWRIMTEGYLKMNTVEADEKGIISAYQFLKVCPDAQSYAWAYENLIFTLVEERHYTEALALMPAASQYLSKKFFYTELYYCVIRPKVSPPRAISLLKQYLQEDPLDWKLNGTVVYLLWQKHDIKGVEKALEKILKIDPSRLSTFQPVKSSIYLEKTDIMASYELLSDAYALDGKMDQSAAVRKIINLYQDNELSHYSTILRSIEKKNIPALIVQYPLRKLENLQKDLPQSKDFYYVDNESSFKRGVDNEGYSSYFIDNGGGDFGHCTSKGFHLLANNIATEVLKIFNFNPPKETQVDKTQTDTKMFVTNLQVQKIMR